ncbi:SET domain-containing protein SmydA-8-like [Lutzomyia longipalpis]|uniref:SET domain-containing protein SmydA-8-like n=1 Tax=Lutzomyia longipalpis TaxID=7200 RepID=UPI00248440BF|nr:SET domain-containing protein SmydA-8-like [Lutzomyia longipalpis]
MEGEIEPKMGNCVICGVECEKKCASCHRVFYCSVEHQRDDWKSHKKSCPVYRICHDGTIGRFLVATRNIKFGDVVLKEAPLVVGPSQLTAPVCLGCLQEVNERTMIKCAKCGWPMCSKDCQEAPNHAEECKLSAARGGVTIEHFVAPHPIYQCILTLRCLLMEQSCPEKWEKISQLESHNDRRKDSQQWLSDREYVAKFIPKFFKIPERWKEEEIMRILGIVYINGHEVPLTDPAYVAIYATASFFEHCCCANVAKSFTDSGDVVFWAARNIKKDEHLSICYTDALWGTQARQEHLQQTKMFSCNCYRCMDVTELGTNFSAIKCEAFREAGAPGCDGLLLPEGPLAWSKEWMCRKCQRKITCKHIEELVEKAGHDAVEMKESLRGCQEFLRKYEKILSPNHFIMCDVKCVMGQKIGEGNPQELQNIPMDMLEMKGKLCNEMLELFALLAPAENRSHGCMHFELHAALAEMARRGAECGIDCKDILEKSLWHAQKATQWLEKEPSVLVEGKICAQAKINVNSLKIVLKMHNPST